MEIAQLKKQYLREHSIVTSCQYPVIFYPKYRRPVLTNGIEDRLKALILEKQEECGYQLLEMEVLPDQVHLLWSCDPRIGVSKIVGKIKGYSSRILRQEFGGLKRRLPSRWTPRVGAVSLAEVKGYIWEEKGV
jgi:putative transposase